MPLERNERAVVCIGCNAFLYAELRTGLDAGPARIARCPYKCRVEEGLLVDEIPANEGRYGRS